MNYVKINDVKYIATISNIVENQEWDNRATKVIMLEMTHDDAAELLKSCGYKEK